MRGSQAHAARSFDGAVLRIWILEALRHQTGLRIGADIPRLPGEHLARVRHRILVPTLCYLFGNAKLPPRCQLALFRRPNGGFMVLRPEGGGAFPPRIYRRNPQSARALGGEDEAPHTSFNDGSQH